MVPTTSNQQLKRFINTNCYIDLHYFMLVGVFSLCEIGTLSLSLSPSLSLSLSQLSAFNNRQMSGVVFLDFHKTFDLVHHDALLKKLYSYNLSMASITFLRSYL